MIARNSYPSSIKHLLTQLPEKKITLKCKKYVSLFFFPYRFFENKTYFSKVF